MPNNPFENEESLSAWFESDQDYRSLKKQQLNQYFQQHQLNRNFFMSYNKIVNFITKNAVIATIIMVLAVGGASTAAAQFFAPEEFKPSNLLFPNDNKSDDSKQTNVTNFEECSKQENAIILETYPAQCQFDGQTFTEMDNSSNNSNSSDDNAGGQESNAQEPESNQNQQLTYTNPNYPDFKIDYFDGWTIKEEKNNQGDPKVRELLNKLIFTKNGVEIIYEFENLPKGVMGFGGPNQICTLNNDLYLEVDNGWSRIRNNDGTREYVNTLKFDQDLGYLDPDSPHTPPSIIIYPEMEKGWVDAIARFDEITFINSATCHARVAEIINTNISDFNSGLNKVRLTGVSNLDSSAVKEADKIISSTKGF